MMLHIVLDTISYPKRHTHEPRRCVCGAQVRAAGGGGGGAHDELRAHLVGQRAARDLREEVARRDGTEQRATLADAKPEVLGHKDHDEAEQVAVALLEHPRAEQQQALHRARQHGGVDSTDSAEMDARSDGTGEARGH